MPPQTKRQDVDNSLAVTYYKLKRPATVILSKASTILKPGWKG